MRHGVKARPAARRRKATRRTAAACPDDPVAGHGQNTPSSAVDPFVGDAGVVGRRRRASPGAARRRPRGCPSVRKKRCLPSAAASAAERCRDRSARPRGGSTARRRRMTRPSRFVIVPSSSAHCADGSTTSASCAVSERKKSDDDEEVERLQPLARRCVPSGAETARFEPMTNSARMPPSVPIESISS